MEKLQNGLEYTQWSINDIIIQEPLSFIGDSLLAVLCFFFAFKIFRKTAKPKTKLYPHFFLFFGVGSLLGAFAHGFFYIFGFNLFRASFYAIMLSLILLAYQSSFWVEKKSIKQFIKIVSIIQGIIFGVFVFYSNNFTVFSFNLGFVLLFILLPITLVNLKKHKFFKHLLCSISLFTTMAIIFISKLSIHKWFNANDICHLIEFAAFWKLFVFVKKQ